MFLCVICVHFLWHYLYYGQLPVTLNAASLTRSRNILKIYWSANLVPRSPTAKQSEIWVRDYWSATQRLHSRFWCRYATFGGTLRDDIKNGSCSQTIDCKTVRIFAYSSMREQSNKRSGTRLKTESETWGETLVGRVRLARFARVRVLRRALPISLLILRKKPTVLQSSQTKDIRTMHRVFWKIDEKIGDRGSRIVDRGSRILFREEYFYFFF